jgi:hypothetical protein
MSQRELEEWKAFYELEPWGTRPADLRAGIVASTVANTARRKGAAPFRPKSFMPDRTAGLGEPNDRALKMKARDLHALYGGRWSESPPDPPDPPDPQD